jgi:hypothetical protein
MTVHIDTTQLTKHEQYARAVAASKRARWDIEADVLRGRRLETSDTFLPDGLSKVQALEILGEEEKRFLSHIQGRTYANVFGLVERFISAKVLEISAHHHLGDQAALEGLVRFSDEEIKHQELFRRVERLCADIMPPGYRFEHDPNDVARAVLGKSTWAVLALTCLIELFTQTHYLESIAPAKGLSPLFKDVFRFHWMEESQHAVLDELEWRAEDARLTAEQRTRAVTDLIELVGAVDAILQAQAAADAAYFIDYRGQPLAPGDATRVEATILRAYRYQYIVSGVERTRFPLVLRELLTEGEFDRVVRALAPLV